MNVQVIASPDGTILWTSGALPGKAHDLTRRPHLGHPARAGAGRDHHPGRQGVSGSRGPGPHPVQGQEQARVPEAGQPRPRQAPRTRRTRERPAESWKILRKLRCSPSKAGHLCKAIAVLQNHRVAQAA